MEEISFGKYTSILYRYIQMMITHDLEPYGLGSGQYLYLITIAKHENISQKQLTKHLSVDKATTAKALAKLESLELIERRKDEEDRRYYKIRLTEKGHEFMPTFRKKLLNVSNVISQGMSEEEKKETVRLMEIMIKNAVEHVDGL